MRMIGPDFALFIVGALLFSGAAYGIMREGGFSAAGGDSNLDLYKVTWASADTPETLGTFAEGSAATEYMTEVNGTNLGQVVIKLDCNDPSPLGGQNGFTYTVEIMEAPEGITAPAGATNVACGTDTELKFPIAAAAPAESEVRAGDAEAAKAEAAKLGNATGSGMYHIKVSGGRANAFPGPIGGVAGGATIAVTATVTSYVPTTAPVNAVPK